MRKDRENQKGGGIAFLLRDEFNSCLLPTDEFSSFEHLAISVSTAPNSARLVVIYRPPTLSLASFIEEFALLLEDIALGGTSIVFAGDFNIHWDSPNDPYTRKFKELCEAFGLTQHIESATHVKGHTLDLILSRQNDNLVLNNPRVCDMISDHFLVACDVSFHKQQDKKRSITYRKIKDIDIMAFRKDISALPLMVHYSEMGLDDLCSAYHGQLHGLLDKHAPQITRSASTKRRDPWDTKEVLEAVRIKRRAERRFRKTRTDNDYRLFCEKRDIFNKTLQVSKTEYLSKVIVDNSRDPTSLFAHMNSIMHKKKENPLPETSSAKSLANDFNTFFKEKVDKIRDNFTQNQPSAFENDAPFAGPTLGQFEPLTENEVSLIIKSSKSKSCELDHLPTTLVKQCHAELIPVITRIVNLSLETGTFPEQFKHAIIRPLLKKPGLDAEMKNYRPVSNLSYLSKVIEEAAGQQFAKHLEKNCLQEVCQSAYKKGHSTETALIAVFDTLLTGLDKPNTGFLVAMLDMSAAFDTVDHAILLERLRSTFGITGTVIQWFESYLSNRTVCVSIDNTLSDQLELDCSLPQGSKLGPRLYSDYTQPLGSLLRLLLLCYHLYADDSGILKQTSLHPTAQKSAVLALSNGINQVQTWTTNNKLKLNPTKTEFMVVCSSRNRSKVIISELDLGNSAVSSSNSLKSLGVIIDQSLSMHNHISGIVRHCMYHLNWIRKVRPYLTVDATKTLVQCYVISRIDYCNSLLASLPKVHLQRLQKVINIAARLIFQQPRDCSITALLKALHWLKIEDRIAFKVLCLTWQSLNNKGPSYLSSLITPHKPKRLLRSSHNSDLCVPKSRTSYGDRAFRHNAPMLWNTLPVMIRNQPTLPLFKNKLKTHLFRKSYC